MNETKLRERSERNASSFISLEQNADVAFDTLRASLYSACRAVHKPLSNLISKLISKPKENLLMIPKPQSEFQCQLSSHPSSTGRAFYIGLLCLLGTALTAGCVSSEKLKAEKVRGLNFQRLLAQEEKRADALGAQLAQRDKEISKLNSQLEETKARIGVLESENRNLTAELNALRKENLGPQKQKSAQDSPGLLQDSGTSKESPSAAPTLSDPFVSDEELLKILE